MEESVKILVDGEGNGKSSSISLPTRMTELLSRQGDIESLTPAKKVKMLKALSGDSRLLCKPSRAP